MNKVKVVFVLGGPGVGKGTQAALIQNNFPFKHLSAGQLLRDEQKREGSQFGTIIENIILDGQIVPSFITTKLIQAAINSHKRYAHFLIDGFPRNLENLNNWRVDSKQMAETAFVLNFECSQEEMVRRLLKRASLSGRSDDNMEVIQKRLKAHYAQTKLVLDEFRTETKVHQFNGDETPEKIFSSVRPIFEQLMAEQPLL